MLGLDKQTISLDGERLVERQLRALSAHFDELVVVTWHPELYPFPGLKLVADSLPGFGPLSGLHAALGASSSEWLFLVACDMPGFDPAYMEELRLRIILARDREVSACVAAFREHIEPFHAFYSKALLPAIETLCASPDSPSIGRLLSGRCHLRVPEECTRRFSPDWSLFRNINTREELAAFIVTEGLRATAMPPASDDPERRP
jgi:molybdopterin-guanine dinucleotide biosynthesis protein A